MSLAAFLAYAFALAIAAALPGPGVTALLARAFATGFGGAFVMALGLVLGDLVFLTLAVLGLAFLAQTFSTAFFVVKLLGAGYLLYLAWRFWHEGISPVQVERKPRKRAGAAAFLGGFAVTLGNPKTVVFYMALLPGVIDMTQIGVGDWAVLCLLTVLVLLVVLVPYIALASQTRRHMSDRFAMKWLGRAASAIMTGTAGFILARG